MKEKPILFNGEMVRAVLEGKKTQTRRPVKVQPSCASYDTIHTLMSTTASDEKRHVGKHRWGNGSIEHPLRDNIYFSCPFGRAGQRIWVRETWRAYYDPELLTSYQFRADMGVYKPPVGVWDECNGMWAEQNSGDVPGEGGKWKPSIHMPRCASRITLEVTNVRVERVQDISEEDAEAEGIERLSSMPEFFHVYYPLGKRNGRRCCSTARASFRHLWDIIYAERGYGWDVNPFVWVCEFKVI